MSRRKMSRTIIIRLSGPFRPSTGSVATNTRTLGGRLSTRAPTSPRSRGEHRRRLGPSPARGVHRVARARALRRLLPNVPRRTEWGVAHRLEAFVATDRAARARNLGPSRIARGSGPNALAPREACERRQPSIEQGHQIRTTLPSSGDRSGFAGTGGSRRTWWGY